VTSPRCPLWLGRPRSGDLAWIFDQQLAISLRACSVANVEGKGECGRELGPWVFYRVFRLHIFLYRHLKRGAFPRI